MDIYQDICRNCTGGLATVVHLLDFLYSPACGKSTGGTYGHDVLLEPCLVCVNPGLKF